MYKKYFENCLGKLQCAKTCLKLAAMLDFGCPVFPLWKEKFRLIERIIEELARKHFLYIDILRLGGRSLFMAEGGKKGWVNKILSE